MANNSSYWLKAKVS